MMFPDGTDSKQVTALRLTAERAASNPAYGNLSESGRIEWQEQEERQKEFHSVAPGLLDRSALHTHF